ncbi:hypothetical protein Pint_33626 [Pistacia integerrima]|uniref:Uncharacterized protein n=1 Tax=Pistacia integerrima TaxID=434235 RepID=A0ACC0X216_9ROSI|nr:hypothetical protein Pint_33626 [Pistacia integerrima]
MARGLQERTLTIETEIANSKFDEDGRVKRTGGIKYKFCGLAQYGNLVGITVGYTITASVSMA